MWNANLDLTAKGRRRRTPAGYHSFIGPPDVAGLLLLDIKTLQQKDIRSSMN